MVKTLCITVYTLLHSNYNIAYPHIHNFFKYNIFPFMKMST